MTDSTVVPTDNPHRPPVPRRPPASPILDTHEPTTKRETNDHVASARTGGASGTQRSPPRSGGTPPALLRADRPGQQ